MDRRRWSRASASLKGGPEEGLEDLFAGKIPRWRVYCAREGTAQDPRYGSLTLQDDGEGVTDWNRFNGLQLISLAK